MTEIFLGKKEKSTNKGTDKQYEAGFFFVIQYMSSLPSYVPSFRILSQVVAEKSSTEKSVHNVLYRCDRRKIENVKKEGKMWISILIFIYTIHFAYLKVYTTFETLAPIGAEKSVTENFIGEKEK